MVIHLVYRMEEGRYSQFKKVFFYFYFCAPIIAIIFENDVDGRDCNILGKSSTPLARLTLNNIKGNFSICSQISSKISFSLHSLHSIDLYQRAGAKFAPLLSSLCQDDLLYYFLDLCKSDKQ